VDTSFAQGDIVSFGNSPVIAGGVYALTGSGTYHGAQADIGALSTGSLAVALTTNSSGGMLLRGVVKMQASYNATGTNVGVPVYLSTNSTRMDTNPPTGTGEIVRILGHHLSGSQTMYFNPDNSFIVLS
jgi:hypothetical protein